MSSTVKGFVLLWTMVDLYFQWKRISLRWEWRGKVSIISSFKLSLIDISLVPVIVIFTKFDDLMTLIYDIDEDDNVNRRNAEEEVERNFRKPLYGYAFPPCADVCFEGKWWRQSVDHIAQCLTLWQICISKQVIIRTKWKFSSRRQHPHLMMSLSRCCLFQCSKTVLISVFNVQ